MVFIREDSLIVLTRNNRPTQQFVVQQCIDLVVKKIQKEYSGYEKVSPHTFRHMC